MAWRLPRNFFVPLRSYSAAIEGTAASAGEHSGGVKTWKMMSFFIAVPGVVVCFINAHIKEKEEQEHLAHHRPDFVPYEHLRIRTKKFPWGDGVKSFFHNPQVNALPDGYEDQQ